MTPGVANIDMLMRPRSVAILGCSPSNAGGTALANLLANNFPGPLYPVHPTHTSVHGVSAFPTLQDLPATADCCIVAVRAERVLDAIEELHAAGIKAAVILASGFSELGQDGIALQHELSRRLERYGIAACGPNCLGILSFREMAALYYAGIDLQDKAGPIGFVSHSGSSCIAVTNAERGTGFSYVVSCGNEAGVSVGDYVRFLAEDESTHVIGLHLEAVRDPKDLADAAAAALAKRKPVVVLKLGRTESGQRTAAAHSGALASPHAMATAFFERHGMILVDSLDELLETCELLAALRHRLPTASAVAVTAVSGGMAGLAADIGTESGVEFANLQGETVRELARVLSAHSTPNNPLDVTLALHDTAAYARCLEILDADPRVGLILVCQGAEPGLNAQQRALYAPIAAMIADAAGRLATPIATFSPMSNGLEPEFNRIMRQSGVAQLMGATSSLRAVKHLMTWKHFTDRDRRPATPPPAAKPVQLGDDLTLSEHQGKSLLSAYKVPVPREHIVNDADAAVAAAQELGYPVVLKVDTPDIAHKTEAGIIALGIENDDDVRQAFPKMIANARSYKRDARILGVSVQECIRPGIEMMVGIKNDSTFGPAVIVGAGGIHTEVLDDAAVRLAPVTVNEAESMLSQLRCNKLLEGARGGPPGDRSALIETIQMVSRMAVDYADEIVELDINPLVVFSSGEGVRALDALIIRSQVPEPHAKQQAASRTNA